MVDTEIEAIKEDIRQAQRAGTEARRPHDEARSQLTRGEFVGWVRRNFKLTERAANKYMDAAVRARQREAT